MKLSDIDAGDYTVFAWCLLQIVLAALYTLRSRWWSSTAGIILCTSLWCTAIALTQVSVTLLTDSGYYARDVVRPIAYGAGILGTVVMLVLLVRTQRKDRDQ